MFVHQERCDVIFEHDSELSADAGVLIALVINLDHGEEHLNELDSIQEFFLLVLRCYYALTLRLVCHSLTVVRDDFLADWARFFKRKDAESVQNLG